MRQSGWGRIVNVSSVAGVMPQPTGPDYSASKAAINNLSLSLTKALGASGVTVNTVSPGMILTPKLEEVFRQMATTNGWVASDASWEEIERAFLKVSQVPLGRIGRAEEVAHAVAFLCSPLASYITGADLRIDAANALNHPTFPSWVPIISSAQFGLPNTPNAMRSVQTTVRVRF